MDRAEIVGVFLVVVGVVVLASAAWIRWGDAAALTVVGVASVVAGVVTVRAAALNYPTRRTVRRGDG